MHLLDLVGMPFPLEIALADQWGSSLQLLASCPLEFHLNEIVVISGCCLQSNRTNAMKQRSVIFSTSWRICCSRNRAVWPQRTTQRLMDDSAAPTDHQRERQRVAPRKLFCRRRKNIWQWFAPICVEFVPAAWSNFVLWLDLILICGLIWFRSVARPNML